MSSFPRTPRDRHFRESHTIVIPANATMSSFPRRRESIGLLTAAKWIPAFSGMTFLVMPSRSIELFHADAHTLAVDGWQRFDLGDRVDDLALDRLVRQQDDIGAVLALGRLLLDHGVDRDLAVGEDTGDISQHAGPVEHPHAQVIARSHLAYRQKRNVGELAGLKREMRNAMFRVRGVQS